MNDSNLFPAVASTKRSICGSGKLSLGQALLRSVKSTQTLHLPFFFLTTTGFANQSGYLASEIEPIFRSFSTSAFTASARSRPNFLRFCLIGLKDGSTFSSWHITSMLTPGRSSADQAKVLMFSLRNEMSSVLISLVKSLPISTHRSGRSSSRLMETTGSEVGFFSSRASSICNCYNCLDIAFSSLRPSFDFLWSVSAFASVTGFRSLCAAMKHIREFF
ncbi:unnamed protein product [Arabidopsis halleri]